MVLARKYQIKFLNIWTFPYFLGWKYYKIPWVKGPSSKQSPWIAKIWQLVWHISKMSLVLHKLNMGRLNIHCMGHCSPYSYCSVVPITRCDCRGNLPQRHIKKILSIHEKKFQILFKHFVTQKCWLGLLILFILVLHQLLEAPASLRVQNCGSSLPYWEVVVEG